MSVNPYRHVRDIAATPERVFAAFADPERHARWWGPDGFRNTFAERDFRSGGRWVYTMHGPDGRDYANESAFREVSPSRLVIVHASNPQYVLTIGLEPCATGTRVSWVQEFETERVASRLESIVRPANEQNLDRLAAEVARV